ncbi:MAG: DUF5689 domain-containing protein [Bacteroidota bacterium]|nr:DUF5689 domain-containing protein [Bacteroidota bacterium]
MKITIKLLSITVLVLYMISGCVKEDFDVVPEKEYTVDFEANKTIAELQDYYSGSNVFIDTNIIIKGVITANDASGNFYKEIYLQDSTAAISMRIDNSDMSLIYPVGQLVYVKCSGLYLGTYNEVFQLGIGSDVDRITEEEAEEYIFKSDGGVPVEPKLVTIGELNDEDLGKLVKFDSLQFQNPNQTYADGINLEDRTVVLEDCNGNVLDLRNSGYADFANDSLPHGNGEIIGIHGKFIDYQLKIRTAEEVVFTNDRCSK